jgi:hypothetical protein
MEEKKSYLLQAKNIILYYVRVFLVLMVASMKITAFWDIVPHSLIEVD